MVISGISRNIHLPADKRYVVLCSCLLLTSYTYHRERVESLILSIQISTSEQNRTMLTEPVSLFIDIGKVFLL